MTPTEFVLFLWMAWCCYVIWRQERATNENTVLVDELVRRVVALEKGDG